MSGFTFHNSERSTAGCEQRWYLKYGLGVTPEVTGKALHVGTVWHKAMEFYWFSMKDNPEKALTVALEELELLRLEELKEHKSSSPDGFNCITNYGGPSLEEINNRYVLIVDMLKGYHEKWSNSSESLNLLVLLNEETLQTHIPNKKGRASHTRFGGTLDKLVQDKHGQIWVVDHKTTSISLDVWRRNNQYKPQAVSYVWLARQVTKYKPVGIVYDLAIKKIPAQWQDFPVINGNRLSKKLPKNATSESFLRALKENEFSIDDKPWYRVAYDNLKKSGEQFFRREYIRISDEEIHRTEQELYAVANKLRGMKNRIGLDARDCLDKIYDNTNKETWNRQVLEHVFSNAHKFPRNGSLCREYFKPCEFMDLCQSQSKESMRTLVPWTFNMGGYKTADTEK